MENISLLRHFRNRKLNLEDFLQYAFQLSEEVHQLHLQGKILRRLWPDLIQIDLRQNKVYINDSNLAIQAVDFRKEDISSILSDEPQYLFYLSPEQTGCLNRKVDYRSDLYALGVIFYQLLTDRYPVKGNSTLEWFHNLAAQKVIPPHHIDEQIPKVLSQIVVKCLAKEPDHRYQSALGLKSDLSQCLGEWQKKKSMKLFSLAQEDVPVIFHVSDKFCGREKELELLYSALERVSSGRSEAVFLFSEAGMGKSRLVQQFKEHAELGKGFFIQGSFEAIKVNAPFQLLENVFHQLFQFIMVKSRQEIIYWQNRVIERLGNNLSLIMEVIPCIELLMGKLTPTEDSLDIEVQLRLRHAFCQLVKVFASQTAPLVIFLDDIHWADEGSLDLIKALFLEEDVPHVLFIGACDHLEITSTHPFEKYFHQMQKSVNNVQVIQVEPIDMEVANIIIVNSLGCSSEEGMPLTRLIFEKTRGNMFLMKEMLKSIFKHQMVVFQPSEGKWRWHLQEIERVHLASDIIDVLLENINLLPSKSKTILQLAACIGSIFQIGHLSILAEDGLKNLENDLAVSVREGLIQRHGSGVFAFVHNRVHQAAYILTPEAERDFLHYRLGWLLIAGRDEAELGKKENRAELFMIVNNLNLGKKFLLRDQEQTKSACLNLLAGRLAKQTGAFVDALDYYQQGLTMLPKNAWQDYTQLIFEANIQLLECLYLDGHFAKGEDLYQKLLSTAEGKVNSTKLHVIKTLSYTRKHFDPEAIQVGLQALQELSCVIPASPSKIYLLRETHKIKKMIDKIGIHQILDLPTVTDVDIKETITLLIALGPCVYNTNKNLYFAITLKMVELSLRYGNSTSSSSAYMMLAIVLLNQFKDFNRGIPLGKTALVLAERNATGAEKQIVNFLSGAFFLPWLEYIRQAEERLVLAKDYSLASWDWNYAGYSMVTEIIVYRFRGGSLLELERRVEQYLPYKSKIKDPYFKYVLMAYKQFSRCLQGFTIEPFSFSDEQIDEVTFFQKQSGEPQKKEVLEYCICKIQIYYLMGNFKEAIPFLNKASIWEKEYSGEINSAEYDFYYCLIFLALYRQLSSVEKPMVWLRIQAKYRRMKARVRHCPANFEHKYLLIGAEIARVRKNQVQATRLYELAIRSSREYKFLYNTAMANECAGKFYLEHNLLDLGKKYLQDAYFGYKEWGAKVKLKQIVNLYPSSLGGELGIEEAVVSIEGTVFNPVQLTQLVDTDAIIQTTRILSQEIVLEKLLEKMMTILLQFAGATRIGLIRHKDNCLFVEAIVESEHQGNEITVFDSVPLNEMAGKFPDSVISYVARTAETIVLDQVDRNELFREDPFLQAQNPASLICMPLIQHDYPNRILYVENGSTAGYFHPGRIETLKALSGQMTISIENAELYRKLQQLGYSLEEKVQERTAVIAQLQKETIDSLIEQSRLEERNRIAREIHDTVGHTITSVLVQIEAGKRLMRKDKDKDKAEEKLERSQEQLRKGLDEIDRSINMLKGTVEREEAMDPEIFILEVSKNTGITVNYEIDPDLILNSAQRYVFYRALQEGITNGIRHGDSKYFDFLLKVEGNEIHFFLQDFGRGVDKIFSGFGLTSMQERVEELRGTIKLDSKRGKGFSIEIFIPIEN